MYYKGNFHGHTGYCDGVGTVEEVVEAAIHKGFTHLGISSHAPVPFATLWAMKKEDLVLYLQDIQNAKNKFPEIRLQAGLEVDYISGTMGPSDFKELLDYTVGSVHFGDRMDGGAAIEFDGPLVQFKQGLEELYDNNIKTLVHRYITLQIEMLEKDPPDIIGHIDKVKIQNVRQLFFEEPASWYRDWMYDLLSVIKQKGVILEVNTRGVYKKKSPHTYPGEELLIAALEKKIPVMVNSDAHHVKELDLEFENSLRMLSGLGFKELHFPYQQSIESVPLVI